MKYAICLARAAAALACALTLASCGGSQAPAPPPPADGAALHRTSWMAPNAGRNLLYVSDFSSVLVYDYGTDKQVGDLSYFTRASGLCTDPRGDVFATNNGAADVLEFAHGGSAPIKTFIDPSPNPVDCAFDQVSGDLAVINSDSIAIYTIGKVRPKLYKVHGFSTYISGSYDASGNLLVSGEASSKLSFALLPHGRGLFKGVTLPHSSQWTGPGYIRWDGEYFDVDFQVPYYQFPTIFEWYTVKGSQGIVEGYTLTGKSGEGAGPFWLGRIGGPKSVKRANQLVACTNSYGVLIWNYPIGGGDIFQLYDDSEAGGVSASAPSKS